MRKVSIFSEKAKTIGLTKKAKNGSRGAKNETRRGKNCVFGPKHSFVSEFFLGAC